MGRVPRIRALFGSSSNEQVLVFGGALTGPFVLNPICPDHRRSPLATRNFCISGAAGDMS